MKWETPLQTAILLKRYKRFLADVDLGSETITAHVPNTGAMTSCWETNWKCALSRSPSLTRKFPYTLELTWNDETWIGVNTANANKLAKLWLTQGLIPELSGYQIVTPEKKVGHSRVDFLLENHTSEPACYVEIKSVTLKKDGLAQFPDSVSVRAQKHLMELMSLKQQGFRAAMLFVVQREDVDSFAPAASIDPDYSRLLSLASASGVEIFVYQCKMSLEELSLKRPLPFKLG